MGSVFYSYLKQIICILCGQYCYCLFMAIEFFYFSRRISSVTMMNRVNRRPEENTMTSIFRRHLRIWFMTGCIYAVSWLEGPVPAFISPMYTVFSVVLLGLTSALSVIAVVVLRRHAKLIEAKLRSPETEDETKKASIANLAKAANLRRSRRQLQLGMIIITGGPRFPYLIHSVSVLLFKYKLPWIEWIAATQGFVLFIWCYRTFGYRKIWGQGQFPCCCIRLCFRPKKVSPEESDDDQSSKSKLATSKVVVVTGSEGKEVIARTASNLTS